LALLACGADEERVSSDGSAPDAGAEDAANPSVAQPVDSGLDAGRPLEAGLAAAAIEAGASSSDAAPLRDAAPLTEAGPSERDAGTDGAAGMKRDECGAIPSTAPKAATPKAVVLHGLTEYHTKPENQFTGVRATLTVPAKPPPTGIIFVWPGTQTLPDGPTEQPVAGGVLQPVLTWGSSCVPGSLRGHSTWWISPVYVNEETKIPELLGCHGGPVISVDVGDRLDLEMRLDKTLWYQQVVDRNSQRSTEFSIDLRGQLQQRALFWIELKTEAKPTEDLIFENIVLTMRDPDPGACALNNRGMNDYVSESRISADGMNCCIDRIVLRAEGVAATTKDP
jgi:hypothetical protein